MAKVYLAGSIRDQKTVEKCRQYILSCGHQITFNWMDEPIAPKDFFERKGLAETMVQAVIDASALVLVLPKERGLGCFIETGIALGLHRRVFLVHGTDPENNQREIKRQSIFWALDNVHHIWNNDDFVKIGYYLPEETAVFENGEI